jgi:lipopolysaccharide biosynthesis glycosyltransferase
MAPTIRLTMIGASRRVTSGSVAWRPIRPADGRRALSAAGVRERPRQSLRMSSQYRRPGRVPAMPAGRDDAARTMIASLSTRESPGLRQTYARPVVLNCDRLYAGAAVTCLTSLYLNAPTLTFDTSWFTSAGDTGAGTPAILAAIDRLADTFGRRIELVTVDDRRFDALTRPRLEYLGTVTYERLLIAELIEADSFLYLDSDTIVQTDIEPLLALPAGDWLIAGAADGVDKVWLDMERRRLGLDALEPVLNSGVAIVNAEAWRRDKVLDRLLAWHDANTTRIELADQDLVNAVLAGRKLVLDEQWNVLLHALSAEECGRFDAAAFRGIFHFSGPTKPWLQSTPAPIRALYEKYAAVSPLRMPDG